MSSLQTEVFQPCEAQTEEASSPTGAIFRQPLEAQQTAEGPLKPLYPELSAEQFAVEASGCAALLGHHCTGLGKESQRTEGQTFTPHVRGGDSHVQQTSPLGLSSTPCSSSQGNVRDSEQAAIAFWSKAELEPISWRSMAGLCARKILTPQWDHESYLVAMVEELEQDTQESTLASWAMEKACDAATMQDDSQETWFRLLRAVEDVALSTKKSSAPRLFQVLSANVSSWRAEHRQWLAALSPEVALLQEVHWTAETLAKETVAMAKLGYEVFSQASPVRKLRLT